MPRRRLVALAIPVLLAGCQPATPSPSPSVSASPSEVEVASPSEMPSPEGTATVTGWRELAVTEGPAAREDHTWTVDGDGDVAYLFGGRAGATFYDDLWAYDLATDTWSAVAVTGPAPRFGHNAAWVDSVGLVVFAGQGTCGFFNDLWAYDPEAGAWEQLPAAGAVPVPRYGSCAALGPDGRLWISHGFTSEGARFADTRAYDFTTSSWSDETPVGDAPVERCLHGCWWSDGTFNLYAGQTTGTTSLDDWWALTVGSRPGTNAWTEVLVAPGPAARNLYALTEFRGAHLVFGGQTLDDSYLADAWLIDHEGGPANVDPGGPAPSARAGAELVTDVTADRVLLFGGRQPGGVLDDLWELTAP